MAIRASSSRVRAGAQPGEAQALLTLAEVRQLIALMNASDLTEIAIEGTDGASILVLRSERAVTTSQPATVAPAAAIMPASSAPAEAPLAEIAPATTDITAPLVGVFHRAMKPGQRPLVAVGDPVEEGQVVGAIESLNVWNEIEAPASGRIADILTSDGQPVEYGQRLMVIVPAGS
jgi:acetyl-CoA carboxylase biotin carboxyl carrier protein